MRWAVAAPFFKTSDDGQVTSRWLDDFVPSDRHSFVKIPVPAQQPGWHERAGRATPPSGWKTHWQQAWAARAAKPDGIITVFPQLAAMAGLQKRLDFSSRPVVAWCFNIGAKPSPAALRLARFSLAKVNRFVVHASAEIAVASEWFDVDPARIEFVHLQRAPIPVVAAEDHADPFIVAMGSANRDYATLFAALAGTGIPATIVASPRAVASLSPPDNVTLVSGLSIQQCWELAQRARFSVVPLEDVPTAAGQVTVIEAMRMGRPVIATRGVGTVDYVEDRKTGLLVDPRDIEGMRRSIVGLWEDAALRSRLTAGADAFTESHLSDEAAGAQLGAILDKASK